MKASLSQLADIMVQTRTRPAHKNSSHRPVKAQNDPLESRPHTSSADGANETRSANNNSAHTGADNQNTERNFEKVLEKRMNSKSERKEENQPADTENADSEQEKTTSVGIPIAEITPANPENKVETAKIVDPVKGQSGENAEKSQVNGENLQKTQIIGEKISAAASESNTENGKSAELNTSDKAAAKPVTGAQGDESVLKAAQKPAEITEKSAEITEKSPEISKKQTQIPKADLNQQAKTAADNIPEEAIKTSQKADIKVPVEISNTAGQVETKKDINNNELKINPGTESGKNSPNSNSSKAVSTDNVNPASINTESKPQTEGGKENRRGIDVSNLDKSVKIEVDDMPKPDQQTASKGIVDIESAESKVNVKFGSAMSAVNQVVRNIESSGIRGREQISMALDPPELGRVHIRFQERNGELVGVISSDKVRTQQDISDEMPALLRSLQNSGVAVKKIEVVLTEEGRQDMLKQENQSTDSNNQNQNTGQGSTQSNRQGQRQHNPARSFTSAYNPANPENQHQQTSNEDAINVYM